MARTKDFDETEVLDKAICLFWHKGYNGTSMQDLVDGLGISRSSLYDTYGDKHSLFVKALERYQEAGAKRMYEVVNKAASAREAISQLLELITADLVNDKQHKGCFVVNAEVEVAPHDVDVSNIICKNEQMIESLFVQAIQRGQETGEIDSKKDVRALARFIVNTVKGMRVSAKTITDRSFFDDIISTTVSVLD